MNLMEQVIFSGLIKEFPIYQSEDQQENLSIASQIITQIACELLSTTVENSPQDRTYRGRVSPSFQPTSPKSFTSTDLSFQRLSPTQQSILKTPPRYFLCSKESETVQEQSDKIVFQNKKIIEIFMKEGFPFNKFTHKSWLIREMLSTPLQCEESIEPYQILNYMIIQRIDKKHLVIDGLIWKEMQNLVGQFQVTTLLKSLEESYLLYQQSRDILFFYCFHVLFKMILQDSLKDEFSPKRPLFFTKDQAKQPQSPTSPDFVEDFFRLTPEKTRLQAINEETILLDNSLSLHSYKIPENDSCSFEETLNNFLSTLNFEHYKNHEKIRALLASDFFESIRK